MIHTDPRPIALSLFESGELCVEELWRRYRDRGGNADVLELDAFIHDVPLLSGPDVEILWITLDELLASRSQAGRSKSRSRSSISAAALPSMASSLMHHRPPGRRDGPHIIRELTSPLARLRRWLLTRSY